MKNFALAFFLICATLMSVGVVEAGPFNRRVYKSTTVVRVLETPKTALEVAKIMAKHRTVGHWGGHDGMFEGCACASTKEAAYRNCCYANSGMRTVDVGYAQDSNGTWYCCRRYSTR